ncbi:hypothetical protein AC1031_016685 [Aphanomyces cochlioides]|nr:hypothetical protein AC1031_016685 [Aphanomyces cochlioides]
MSDPNVYYTQEFAREAERNNLRIVDLYRDFEPLIEEEEIYDEIMRIVFLQPAGAPAFHHTPETSAAASEDEDKHVHNDPAMCTTTPP